MLGVCTSGFGSDSRRSALHCEGRSSARSRPPALLINSSTRGVPVSRISFKPRRCSMDPALRSSFSIAASSRNGCRARHRTSRRAGRLEYPTKARRKARQTRQMKTRHPFRLWPSSCERALRAWFDVHGFRFRVEILKPMRCLERIGDMVRAPARAPAAR
jgi:hypothetical protein